MLNPQIWPTDISELLADKSKFLLFETVSGSHAYGTQTPESDLDLKGIYCLSASAWLSLNEPPKQLSDARNDVVYYSLKRFFELASEANPNIIEMLFMPSDCIRFSHPLMDDILAARALFVSKKAVDSHVGYAVAQIKKARGRNKWVNNPQPEVAPVLPQFCRFMANGSARPKSLDQRLLNRAVSLRAVPHARDLYALFDGDKPLSAYLDAGRVTVDQTPWPEQAPFGLLVVNQDGFQRAKSDHKNYWTWRNQRNESRWRDQEQGQVDYDAKNMMHTFRLLYSGIHLLETGAPLVRFTGEKLEYLQAIRRGEPDYDVLIDKVECLTANLQDLKVASKLPDSADLAAINDLLFTVTKAWEAGK